jgi:hypothetical protein
MLQYSGESHVPAMESSRVDLPLSMDVDSNFVEAICIFFIWVYWSLVYERDMFVPLSLCEVDPRSEYEFCV